MEKKYIYDQNKNRLIVTSDATKMYEQNAVKSFCNDYHIDLHDFNIPVFIQENVKYCVGLLKGCESFNQPVVIPQGVVWCNSMFCVTVQPGTLHYAANYGLYKPRKNT